MTICDPGYRKINEGTLTFFHLSESELSKIVYWALCFISRGEKLSASGILGLLFPPTPFSGIACSKKSYGRIQCFETLCTCSVQAHPFMGVCVEGGVVMYSILGLLGDLCDGATPPREGESKYAFTFSGSLDAPPLTAATIPGITLGGGLMRDGGAGGGGVTHRGPSIFLTPCSPPFCSSRLQEAVKSQQRANVVLSDMAPSFSGDRDMDQGRVAALLLDALAACAGDENLGLGAEAGPGDEGGGGGGGGFLARGGTFLGKFLAGRDEKQLKDEAGRLFATVRVVKPPASRPCSSEMYLLATGFLEK